MAPARMQTKVRVKRAELMKIVEGRIRNAENEYKRAVAAHPGKVEKWYADCATLLERSPAFASAVFAACKPRSASDPCVL